MRGLDPRISLLVTPTKVGVQLRESVKWSWIPAFAGMTMEGTVMRGLDPHIRHLPATPAIRAMC